MFVHIARLGGLAADVMAVSRAWGQSFSGFRRLHSLRPISFCMNWSHPTFELIDDRKATKSVFESLFSEQTVTNDKTLRNLGPLKSRSREVQILGAFEKRNSTSSDPPPNLPSDLLSQVSRICATINWFNQNVQVSTLPRYGSQSQSSYIQSEGRTQKISPRDVTQSCENWRTANTESQQNRECRDLLLFRLESGRQPSTGMLSRPLVRNRPFNHQLMQKRHYTMSPIVESGRWMRITGAFVGPLGLTCPRHPFLKGGVRFKSKKKMKKAKAKKKETLQKIKRMRVVSKKSKEEMTYEEKLEFRLMKGRKKMELIKQAIAKFPVQYIPPEDPDIEVLTAEQMHYLKKIGYKNHNYVPVGRRGIYGGTIQNIHMHWKKHETVQIDIAGFTKEEIKVMAVQLARLSGGVLIDIHQNNIVILYRGRNYKMPKELIPIKTLDKRKALAKSKLEQSLKALLDNDKKVEELLLAYRKELAEGGGQPSRKLQPEPKLEDPDEYSEWSGSEGLDDDDDEDDCISDLDVTELGYSSSFLSESGDDSDSKKNHSEGDKADSPSLLPSVVNPAPGFTTSCYSATDQGRLQLHA